MFVAGVICLAMAFAYERPWVQRFVETVKQTPKNERVFGDFIFKWLVWSRVGMVANGLVFLFVGFVFLVTVIRE